MKKQNPVVHFEMPAVDKKRVSEFYTKVFGWNMQQLGEDMGSYVLATTSETGEDGFPKQPGMINGGFFDRKEDELNHAPHVVISVDKIEDSIKEINESGGKVLTDIMDIPGIGKYVSFKDTEGNIVGALQPLPMGNSK